jgi:hypothetical protein
MRLFLLALVLCFAAATQAQTLSSVSTRWSDSFVEWEIYAFLPQDTSQTDSLEVEGGEEEDSEVAKEEFYGELKLRWLNVRDDFSEWDYQLGDERGTIKQKWKDDIFQWELRNYDGNVVTMRTSWPGDFTEWRVTDNSISLNLKSKWKNQFDEWLVEDSARGNFYLYTYTIGDPRDWAIVDSLNEEVSQSMKMALIFLTVFCASPRQ